MNSDDPCPAPAPATAPAASASAVPAPASADLAVDLRGLTKRFGPVTAVDDLTLQVPRGQVLALLGPNGAGKSVTTEMILGLQRPDAGTARVHGLDPARACREGLVGAMLQSGALLDEVSVATMLHLVAGVCAHPRPIGEVVEQAAIAGLLKRGTGKLSGGEAQRVRFALALLPDPEVILLDEPTVAMDVTVRRRFWERMRHVAADGRTVIFATHYLEEADQEADRVVVLDRGRIVADGTGSEIKERIGGRVITCALVGPDAAGESDLAQLPGVAGVQRLEDGRLRLACGDSDRALLALFGPGGLAAAGRVRDVAVSRPSLEEAFVQLTSH